MKAQLENSQEEVTTGAQGATSGQKGPERARKGQKGPERAYRAKKAFLSTILLIKNSCFTVFDSKPANV
jgi:hypothetical protein